MTYLLSFVFGTVLVYSAPIQPVYTINEVVEHLAQCESSNNPQAMNRFDPNTPSFGLLQFKLSTFNSFGEAYNLPHTDIMNPKQQIDIARKMLRDGYWKHWFNCLRKIYEKDI